MVKFKSIPFESQMKLFQKYKINSGKKLKEKNDPVFLKVSKELKVRVDRVYTTFRKKWKQILEWQPMLEIVDCCHPNVVSIEYAVHSKKQNIQNSDYIVSFG